MKKWLLVLLPLAMACSNRETASQSTTTADDAATPLPTAASAPDAESRTGTGNGEELTIFAPELTAKSGDNVCVDVLVSGFTQLLSMQYTITWNKNVLEFTGLKNFKLPYLDNGDFGTNQTQNGFVTTAWIDESLKGTSVTDSSSIYQVCFLVKGKPGESSYFKITDSPTSIEVVNLREKIIPLKKKIGKVTVQ